MRPRSSPTSNAGRSSAAHPGLGAGLALGALGDHLLADPRRGHPVAAFGRLAAGAERVLWRDSIVRGGVYAVALAGAVGAVAEGLRRGTRRSPGLGVPAVAAATWVALGGRSLTEEATAMARSLDAGNLATGRARLPNLCGRDPAGLGESELTRATVESLAENASDAVVAPLLWGALAGLPGLLTYRAVNTLDAMVGHRSRRYERFGRVAARADDVANLIPARITGILIVLLAPVAAGSVWRAARVLARDRRAHPSPNAGWCEAAMAGALDVRLGGSNRYPYRWENRPVIGDGGPPLVSDIDRAVRLCRAVAAAATGLAVAGVTLAGVITVGLTRRGG